MKNKMRTEVQVADKIKSYDYFWMTLHLHIRDLFWFRQKQNSCDLYDNPLEVPVLKATHWKSVGENILLRMN